MGLATQSNLVGVHAHLVIKHQAGAAHFGRVVCDQLPLVRLDIVHVEIRLHIAPSVKNVTRGPRRTFTLYAERKFWSRYRPRVKIFFRCASRHIL